MVFPRVEAARADDGTVQSAVYPGASYAQKHSSVEAAPLGICEVRMHLLLQLFSGSKQAKMQIVKLTVVPALSADVVPWLLSHKAQSLHRRGHTSPLRGSFALSFLLVYKQNDIAKLLYKPAPCAASAQLRRALALTYSLR